MPHIKKPTVTVFAATDSKPAYIALGGLTTKQFPDGSSVDVRIEPYTVAPDAFLAAANRLLKPQLDAVVEKSAANLRSFLEGIESAKRGAVLAHLEFEREQRRLFAAASGAAVNQTLDAGVLNTGKPTPLATEAEVPGATPTSGEPRVEVRRL